MEVKQLSANLQIERTVTTGMKLEGINWDKQFEEDLKDGTGFIIDDVEGINKNNVRSERGIYSPLFGGNLNDDTFNNQQYRCSCTDDKGLVGRFYYDEKNPIICPRCGKPVEYKNNDMDKTGWIPLREDLHLINPRAYYMMEKLIGGKHLNDILYYNKERDEDGNVIVNMDYYDEDNPFYNIGMREFYNRYEEILAHYAEQIKGTPALRKEKKEIYKYLLDNKDGIVFVNHVPVYTLLIRPILMIKNNMIYAKINSKYQSLLVNMMDLNKNETDMDNNDIKVLNLMHHSQMLLNSIHDITVKEQVSGKDGHIRSNMLGERINFSSRCVIVPFVGHIPLNVVELPYMAFLELYKYEIINLICKMEKLTINKANRRWNKAVEKFDKKVYMIMQYLMENTVGGLTVFLNRNPSLVYGSLLTMTVVSIGKDPEDLTLKVPLNVLQSFNADFDGDVMNSISIKTREFSDHYQKTFNPRLMMIDRNDGHFNNKMNLIKDQMTGLYSFCK